MDDPQVVSRDEWLAARRRLLAKEKEFTRQRDALNAERRRLPMTEMDKEYVFEGRDGKASLLDLFGDCGQLLIYHFMFDPDWEEGCKSCSLLADNIGHLAHLNARDTTLALVSRAPLAKIEPFRQRMGWTVPWYSSCGSAISTTISTSRWTRPSPPSSTTTGAWRNSARSGRAGLGRCTVSAPSSAAVTGSFIPTPATRGALTWPPAHTTGSTSPPADGRKTGSSHRGAATVP
jgi:hypothetical protein